MANSYRRIKYIEREVIFILTLIIINLNLSHSDRHASRYSSPEPNRFIQQNENLVHYIESWLTLAKQLIKQQEQMMLNKSSMIDDEKMFDDSLASTDNNLRHGHLLYQLRVRFVSF